MNEIRSGPGQEPGGEERRARPAWPSWTEPLRPDALTLRRLRASILEAASPLLATRRLTWWEVASNWASLLTPVAAAAAVLFAVVALREQPVPAPAPSTAYAESPRLEDLVRWASAEELPQALIQDSTADLDVVLAAIHGEP